MTLDIDSLGGNVNGRKAAAFVGAMGVLYILWRIESRQEEIIRVQREHANATGALIQHLAESGALDDPGEPAYEVGEGGVRYIAEEPDVDEEDIEVDEETEESEVDEDVPVEAEG